MAADPLTLEPDELEVLDDAEDQERWDDILDRAARLANDDFEAELRAGLITEAEAGTREGLRWLAEAFSTHLPGAGLKAWIQKQFDKDKHPRWPAGTPGGKGGEWMQVGERFIGADGSPYEITAIHDGKVYAHLATGKATDAKMITLKPEKTADGLTLNVKPAPPQKVGGDKSHSADVAGTIVIDPYVDEASHDSSIAAPAGFSAEQWKRFGQADQERILALQERFGPWEKHKSKTIISNLKKQYDSATQQVVSSALSSQYGSSSGSTISLTKCFSGSSSGAQLAAAQAQYEKAKLLLEDVGSAIQWDLYHRTRAPDVCAFHWGGTSPTQQKKLHVDQGIPIMPAYSMSTGAFQTTSFGSNLTAVPMAIRHVQMHTHSGGVYTSYEGEYEITTGHRMKLTGDKALFTSNGGMPSDVKKYLQKHAASGGEPASGAVILEAIKAIKDPSYELPVPPEPPGIAAVPKPGQKTYELPPITLLKDQGVDIAKVGYQGGVSAEEATKPANEHDFQAGDLMEGLKGTKYVLIPDAQSQTGLRYVKIDPSTGYLVDKSFPLDSNQPFRKLEGHVQMPKPKAVAGAPQPWPQAQIDALKKAGPPTKLASFSEGMIFKADGATYKVTAAQATTGNKPKVLNLAHPEQGEFFVNSGFKTEPLALDGSYVPPPTADPVDQVTDDVAQPSFVPKDGETFLGTFGGKTTAWLLTKTEGGEPLLRQFGNPTMPHASGSLLEQIVATAEPMPKYGVEGPPEVGDAFTHDGKKHVISSILKDGTVRAKPTGGKVEKFEPGHAALKGLYRPDAYVIGEKYKLKDFSAGKLISGSDAKARPYLVMGQSGMKTHLLNLETGEHVQVSKNQSRALLIPASAKAPEPKVQHEAKHSHIGAMVSGEKTTIAEFLTAGGGYAFNYDKTGVYEYKQTPEGWSLQKVGIVSMESEGDPVTVDNEFFTGATGDSPIYPLVAKEDVPTPAPPTGPVEPSEFDMAKWQPVGGPAPTINDMEIGQVFLSATGLPLQLKSKTPKGGATATALHNGKLIKNLPYAKAFTPLELKTSAPSVPHEQLSKGDVVNIGDLHVGDTFTVEALKETDPNGFYKIVALGDAHTDPTVELYYNGTTWPTSGLKEIGDATFIAKAEDGPDLDPTKAPPAAAQPQAKKDFDPFELNALVADFYLHPKGGKKENDKIGMMANGVVFKTKDGQVLKKVSSGFMTANVVSDGTYLYKVDGDLRGQVITDQTKINAFNANDKSPEHPDELKADPPNVAHVKAKLVDVPPGADISELAVGDYWEGSGPWKGVWKIGGVEPGGAYMQCINLETGEDHVFSTATPPSKWYAAASEPEDTPSPADSSIGPAAEGLGLSVGDYMLDEDGQRQLIVPASTFTPDPIHGAASFSDENSVFLYDMTTKTVYATHHTNLTEFTVAGGNFHVLDEVQAYTVSAGAAKATVVGSRTENGVDKIVVRVHSTGVIEALPVSAVHVPSDSSAEEAPELGGFMDVLPSQMLNNTGSDAVTLKDLAVGDVYAFKDSATGKFDVKMITGTDPVMAGYGAGSPSQAPSPMFTPTYIWRAGGPAPAAPEPEQLDSVNALQPGAFFEHEGVTWQKVSGGSAVLIAKPPGSNQLADVGETVPFMDEDVKWLPNYQIATSSSGRVTHEAGESVMQLEVGDSYVFKATGEFDPALEHTFTVVGKDEHGVSLTDEEGNDHALSAEANFYQAVVVTKGGAASDPKWVNAPFQKGQAITWNGTTPWGGEVIDYDPEHQPDTIKIRVTHSAYGDVDVGNEEWIIPDPMNGEWTAAAEPAPAPGPGVPMTTEAAQEAGLYTVAGQKTPKDALEDFDLVQLPSGSIAYMRQGKLFVMGAAKPSTTKAQSFKRVSLNFPLPGGDAELVSGGKVYLEDVPIGGFFSLGPADYVVIGRGDQGTHGMNLNTGAIAFSGANGEVTERTLQNTTLTDNPGTIASMASDGLSVGDSFYFGPDKAYAYEVTAESPGHFTAKGAPGTPNENSPFTWAHDEVPMVYNVAVGGASFAGDPAEMALSDYPVTGTQTTFGKLGTGQHFTAVGGEILLKKNAPGAEYNAQIVDPGPTTMAVGVGHNVNADIEVVVTPKVGFTGAVAPPPTTPETFDPFEWVKDDDAYLGDVPRDSVIVMAGDNYFLVGDATPGGGKYLTHLSGPKAGESDHSGSETAVTVLKKVEVAPEPTADDEMGLSDFFQQLGLHDTAWYKHGENDFEKVQVTNNTISGTGIEVMDADGGTWEAESGELYPENWLTPKQKGRGKDLGLLTPGTEMGDWQYGELPLGFVYQDLDGAQWEVTEQMAATTIATSVSDPDEYKQHGHEDYMDPDSTAVTIPGQAAPTVEATVKGTINVVGVEVGDLIGANDNKPDYEVVAKRENGTLDVKDVNTGWVDEKQMIPNFWYVFAGAAGAPAPSSPEPTPAQGQISHLSVGSIFAFESGGEKWKVMRWTPGGSMIVKPVDAEGPMIPVNANSTQPIYDILPF